MKYDQDKLELTKEQKSKAVDCLKSYAEEALEVEMGGLQAEIFLDFISEKIGIYYYNKAIADAMSYFTDKTEDMFLLMKDE